MGFPWTLQRYIFREMGKTFLLTSAALTGILGLGGGVLEMIKFGEVTTEQLLRLMGLVLPVAAALTLPVAALFAAAATYGRLSADNEFVACRSSGINLHVLLLPTVVLSLLSAGTTFAFVNFLIPRMVRNLNDFVGADLGSFVQQRLDRRKGIELGGRGGRYRLYADQAVVNPDNRDHVILQGVAFIEAEREEWVRYGTAQAVNLRFDRDAARIQASGSMSGLSFFDRHAGRFADVAEQQIPPNELPALVPPQIKFLNLPELFRYLSDPGSWYPVRDTLDKVRAGLGRRFVYDAVLDDWSTNQRFSLGDATSRCSIHALQLERLPRDAGLRLTHAAVDEDRAGRKRTYAAKRATLEVTRGETLEAGGVRLELFDVVLRDGATSVTRAKETLGPFPLDAEVTKRVAALADEELLAADAGASPDDPLVERVDRAKDMWDGTVRRIRATLSERFAFSASVLVLLILGAVLGIVFRGAHVVVAFGISFVPSLLVIIAIVTGRQLAGNAGTHVAGLALMWVGLFAVALLDGWTLTRVLRR